MGGEALTGNTCMYVYVCGCNCVVVGVIVWL